MNMQYLYLIVSCLIMNDFIERTFRRFLRHAAYSVCRQIQTVRESVILEPNKVEAANIRIYVFFSLIHYNHPVTFDLYLGTIQMIKCVKAAVYEWSLVNRGTYVLKIVVRFTFAITIDVLRL